MATASMPSGRAGLGLRHRSRSRGRSARSGARPSASPEAAGFFRRRRRGAPATSVANGRPCAREPMHQLADEGAFAATHHTEPGSCRRRGVAASLDRHRLIPPPPPPPPPPPSSAGRARSDLLLVDAPAGEVVERLLGHANDVLLDEFGSPRARRLRDASGNTPIPAPPSRRIAVLRHLGEDAAKIDLTVAERAEASGALDP